MECHCPWGAEGAVHEHRPAKWCPSAPREVGPDEARCLWAGDEECGVEYRPGELGREEWCRLDAGHGGKWHSTRRSPNEHAGFEWQTQASEIDWPT